MEPTFSFARPQSKFFPLNPTYLFCVLCVYQFISWTIAPLVMNSGLHVNVLSVALWGREWLMVSYKHPNLPGWVFEVAEDIFGDSFFLAYALAQAFVVATFIFTFLLSVDILKDKVLALAATAPLLGVLYFSEPSSVFNHNIVQMPFWMAFIWLFNRALEGLGPSYWFWTAIVAALSMYDKLSSGMLLAMAAAWLAVDPRGRASLRTLTPFVAALLFGVAILPLAYALIKSNMQPISYAENRVVGGHTGALELLVSMGGIMAVPIAILWFSGAVRLRELRTLLLSVPTNSSMRFVSWFMLLPIGLCALLTPFFHIRVLWLTPMFSLWGLYLIGNLQRKPTAQQVRRIVFLSIAASFIAMLGYVTFSLARDGLSSVPPRWQDWPQQRITAELDRRWAEKVRSPLRIVAGAAHLAGAVALWSKSEPTFFEDLDPKISPWISDERIKKEGALIIWKHGDRGESRIAKYAARFPVETFVGSWSSSAGAMPIEFYYIIVPPADRDST